MLLMMMLLLWLLLPVTTFHNDNVNNNRISWFAPSHSLRTEKTMGRGGAGECGAAEPPDL